MTKAKFKVTDRAISDLGMVVHTTVELLDADGVMVEYGVKEYHDDQSNKIIDIEIENMATGEDVEENSIIGKAVLAEIDEYESDNDNTSSTGDSVKDVINEYIANQQAKDDRLRACGHISVSEKVNYFLAELGINDDEFEDHIHTLITHHKHVQSDKRDSMTYEDAHVNHDIVVPCSAELDNEMYNESI